VFVVLSATNRSSAFYCNATIGDLFFRIVNVRFCKVLGDGLVMDLGTQLERLEED
jgi:hypothetical protein